MDSPPASRFQFELSTLLWLMGAVGVFLSLWRWQGFPYWTIMPAGFMLIAWIFAGWRYCTDLAWGLFAIGWCWCLADTIHWLMMDCFMSMGGPPSTEEMRERLLAGYTSSILLSLYFTFPIVLRAARSSRESYSFARKWLVIAPMIGLLDVTLLTTAIVIAIQISWPWW